MLFAQQMAGTQIQWITNYDEAARQAQQQSKPMVLFFTGSDWCGWCNKLENEILIQPEFANAVADKFIFVKLDFPQYRQQDVKEKDQNQRLKTKYSIHGFPTIVVLSARQEPLGNLQYHSTTPYAFANELLRLVNR
jgi:protein disulfide-isomerase